MPAELGDSNKGRNVRRFLDQKLPWIMAGAFLASLALANWFPLELGELKVSSVTFFPRPHSKPPPSGLASASVDPERFCASLGVIGKDCLPYEQVLERLRSAPVVYSAPKRLVYDEPARVSLVLDLSGRADVARFFENAPGELAMTEVKVTRRMSAELTGDPIFKIEAEQTKPVTITEEYPAQWTWKVTPTDHGADKPLTYTLYAYIERDGKTGDAIPVKSYTDTVRVDVTSFGWVKLALAQFGGPATAITGAIGTIVAVFLWFRNKKWRPSSGGGTP